MAALPIAAGPSGAPQPWRTYRCRRDNQGACYPGRPPSR